MDLINFTDWLKKFPELSLANEKDSYSLFNLFNEKPMEGNRLSLKYDRSPDYFAFLRCHSPNHFVLILKDEEKASATGTLVIRPGIIKGNRSWVGYLGDLRISNPKKWGRFWRKFYKTLMSEISTIRDFNGAIHWQTCILSDNKKAKNALIQSKVLGYHPYSGYQMNNLIMNAPFAGQSQTKVSIATNEDIVVLKNFWKEQYLKRDFGYVFDNDYDELSFRLNSWPGCSESSIIFVKEDEKILGATLLWNPTKVKKIIIQQLPPSLKMVGNVIRILSPWPREKEELKCLYTTLFQVSDKLSQEHRNRICHALLSKALAIKNSHDAHVVAFASFDIEPWTQVLKKFISIKTDLDLLTVDPQEKAKNDYGRYSSPGFEMALV